MSRGVQSLLEDLACLHEGGKRLKSGSQADLEPFQPRHVSLSGVRDGSAKRHSERRLVLSRQRLDSQVR